MCDCSNYDLNIIHLSVIFLSNRVSIDSESSVAGSLTSVFSEDTVVSALLGPLVSQSSSFKLGSVAFKYSSTDSPKWSFDLGTSFQLPAPFTQDSPSAFNLSLAVDASDAKTLTGTFSSSLALPGSSDNVQFGVTATMSISDNEKTLTLQGTTNDGQKAFDGFHGLSVDSMSADVNIIASDSSVTLKSLKIAGKFSLPALGMEQTSGVLTYTNSDSMSLAVCVIL